MKTLIKILMLVALVAGLAALAIASETTTSSVSITFNEITEIGVTDDPGPLIITAPTTPGALPADQSDTSTKMRWTANVASGTKKITGSINTSLPTGLHLYATVTVTGSCGTQGAEQELVTGGADFVTGITNCNTGTTGGTITFRTNVTSMVAPDTYARTVTWTLTAAS